MDQKKIVPLLGNEGPFSPAGEYSRQERKSGDTLLVEMPWIAGNLSIYVLRDPSFSAFSQGLSGEDRFLDTQLSGNEWGAIFLKVLGCPDVSDMPRLPNEDTAEWQKRYSLKFQQAIPDYPMLGRIWDLYIYVSYKPEEINQLRAECLKVWANSNEKALSGLAKLIEACDEALKIDSGLLFAPD